ncbi:MAG: SH3 domain-containing protein [Candidatus Omnitrophota bacterium]
MRRIIIFLLIIGFISILVLASNTVNGLGQNSELKKYTGIITADSVNLRSGPGLNFEILRKVDCGDLVLVVDKELAWVKLKLPRNCNSYVHKEYITALNDISGQTTSDRVNVRAGCGTEFNVIGQLNKQDPFEIVDFDGDWVKIYPYTNCFAWVHEDFVKMQGAAEIYEKVENIKKESVSLLISAEEFEKIYLAEQNQSNDKAPILQKYQAIMRDYPKSEAANIAKKHIEQLVDSATPETEIKPAETIDPQLNPSPNTVKKTKSAEKKIFVSKKTVLINTPVKADIVQLPLPKEEPIAQGKLLDAGRVLNRTGTHKLYDKDKQIIYDLKSSLLDLNKFIYYKVKIWGKIDNDKNHKHPLIEVSYIQKLN